MKKKSLHILNDTTKPLPEAVGNGAELFHSAMLDAIPAPVCVLDAHGKIVAVNYRWQYFEGNSLEGHENCVVGANYLESYPAWAGLDDKDVIVVRNGIDWTISGLLDSFSHEYSCSLPGPNQWQKLFINRVHHKNQNCIILIHFDVTEHRETQNRLNDSNAVLDAVIACNWLLYSSVSWHKIMPSILEMIATASGYSRIRLFHDGGNTALPRHATCIYHWMALGCDQGTVAVSLKKIDYATAGCERWRIQLSEGLPISGAIKDFPAQEQDYLKSIGIQVLTLIPIASGADWWGFLAIECCGESRKIAQHELRVLMGIGRSISAAIERESSTKRLSQAMIAFDSAAEGIVITDDKTNITAINKGVTEITGYNEDDLLGNTPHKLRSDKHDRAFYADMRYALQQEGYWHGDVWNQRKNGDIYPARITISSARDNEGKISNYVAVFSDISEVQQTQNQLHELANRDTLTGLPNRRLLNELMGHAIRRAEREKNLIAVLFIDLDRFKVVNDTLGHQTGDKLLAAVGIRLAGAVRESDTVAHLGGDEFAVMMDSLRDTEDAAVVARKIIQAVCAEFTIDDSNIFIGASIGISIYPNDGQKVDDLIKSADIAMSKIKNDGKNNYRFYSSDLSVNAFERFNLETQLRHALNRDQFEVFYQPQISLASGRIVGAEALIRWRHPELGLVAPDKFIPLAEECGIIIPMGEWVLREAARQVMSWVSDGYALQWISVNVSGIQIQRSNFVDTVYGVLVETECNPRLLELEITESTIMHNTEDAIVVFGKIKDLGVRMAIDDFGTGYSSLSHLKRLPLDKLKIDKSFVRDLPHNADDAAISRAIQALGSSLGLIVIAEGVETAEQAQFLFNLGCEEAQGYLYSRPVSATVFAELLAAEKQKEN